MTSGWRDEMVTRRSSIEAAIGRFFHEPVQFHFADTAERAFHLYGLKKFEASRCNTAKFVSIRYVGQSVKITIRCTCKEISAYVVRLRATEFLS